MAEPTGDAGRTDVGPRVIAPVDFRGPSRPPRRPRSIRRRVTLATVVILGAVLAVSGWFVLTARQVQLSFEPPADRFEISGQFLRFAIGDSFLVRPGTYTVDASRAGYHPLREPFVVGKDASETFRFAFEPLPGLVSFDLVGGDDPDTRLDGVEIHVDGTPRGATPLETLELAPGEHELRLVRDRYRDLETSIAVEGYGREQTVAFELRPDWAEVTVESVPAGAEIRVDGRTEGETPCRVPVPSGPRTIELVLDGYDDWRRELTVVAEQPVALTEIELIRARGRVLVETDPPGAQVIVAGAYAGVSPIEVEVEPDRDLVVRAARDGYEPAESTVRVGSRETERVALRLTPQQGTVLLEVDPPDALLVIDGAAPAATPVEITLTAVEHRLEFRRDGYEPVVRTVRPRPGVVGRLSVKLTAIAKAPSETKEAPRPAAANGYVFVPVEPASSTIGASRREQGRRTNETLRTVRFERPFLIGVTEVTNAQFGAFRADHDSGVVEGVPLGAPDRPVVDVTWDDAARFCNWLSAQDGLPDAYVEVDGAMRALAPMSTGYRLPTEAEWEYAARFDGTDEPLKYPWGRVYPPRDASGNYADESARDLVGLVITGYRDGHAATAPAASFAPGFLGLHDMGGNVAEWCHDFYTTYTYNPDRVEVDPAGPADGRHHVVRGSSWRHAAIGPLRFAYRDYSDETRDDLGFRICRYIEPTEPADEDDEDHEDDQQ